mmetsp:Transcript_19242/g.24800  ORF Transcript_19242/g.24800 Transcript_19242/m.24800 type:complete len:318 (+) Transcript_19242:76-1029(+)
MSDQNLSASLSSIWEKNSLLLTLTTLLCLVAASASFLSRQKFKTLEQEDTQARKLRGQSRAKRAENPFDASSATTPAEGSSEKVIDPNNVWKDRRQKGVVPAPSSTRQQPASRNGDKPFHSSYYYAHNSNNSKGGYSDGLQMEDFTMNVPRLLSKGGKPVVEEQSSSIPFIEELFDEEPQIVEENASSSRPKSSSRKRVLNITKYLWDDPGDSKGVASLLIDTLPSPTGSGTVIEWKDASIVEFTAKLSNDAKGLLVMVQSDDVEYRLEMKQLYGDVASVKAIAKAKRLIVKLKKTTGLLYRSNLEAWPHPQKRGAA